MLLLSLDPSSTRTGYALMHGAEDRQLVEAGILKPTTTKDARTRIRQMAADLRALLAETAPDEIVIEVPGSQVSRGRHAGGAGLTIYGTAVGYLLAVLDHHAADRVIEVDAWVWTKGQQKAKRTTRVGAMYRNYDERKDRGGDCADAIGLGRWWLRHKVGQLAVGQLVGTSERPRQNAAGPSGGSTPVRGHWEQSIQETNFLSR
jgi:Holliday junction resolvasome RuvABC endonuclease subunit